MAINRNSNLSEELRDVFKLQQNVDGSISNIAGQIVPVVDVNPKHARVVSFSKTATASNSTSSNIILSTEFTGKRIFLTGGCLSLIKDASSTSTYSRIRVYFPDGSAQTIALIVGISLTANSGSMAFSFNTPLEIKQGQVAVVENSTNIANISAGAVLYGYTIDNPAA